MTVQELKRKLVDRISKELLKDNINSEDFINYAQAVCILIDYENCECNCFEGCGKDTETTDDKIDLVNLWSGIKSLYNKKN